MQHEERRSIGRPVWHTQAHLLNNAHVQARATWDVQRAQVERRPQRGGGARGEERDWGIQE